MSASFSTFFLSISDVAGLVVIVNGCHFKDELRGTEAYSLKMFGIGNNVSAGRYEPACVIIVYTFVKR
jgi:hypothetical protein